MYEDDGFRYNDCSYCERVELKEYEEEFRALLDKAYSEKHQNILDDMESYKKYYEDAKEANKNYKKTNSELEDKIKDLEAEIKESKKQYEEIGRIVFEKALKELTGGPKVGDYIYARYNTNEYVKCNQCNKGSIYFEKNGIKLKAKCPYCNGNGRIDQNVSKVTQIYITSITFHHYKDNDGKYKKSILINSDGRSIKHYYETQEECQKECDEMNKIEEERVAKLLAGELPEDDMPF